MSLSNQTDLSGSSCSPNQWAGGYYPRASTSFTRWSCAATVVSVESFRLGGSLGFTDVLTWLGQTQAAAIGGVAAGALLTQIQGGTVAAEITTFRRAGTSLILYSLTASVTNSVCVITCNVAGVNFSVSLMTGATYGGSIPRTV